MLPAAYLDLAGFKARTVMPPEDVDRIETKYPGYVLARLVAESATLRGRLIKRYAVEFGAPVPELLAAWLTDIVTPQIYRRRGWNPSSAQDAEIDKAAERARADVLEAANGETGLFELPLREDLPGSSGVSRGGPFGYSEASPYAWTDRQAEAVRDE